MSTCFKSLQQEAMHAHRFRTTIISNANHRSWMLSCQNRSGRNERKINIWFTCVTWCSCISLWVFGFKTQCKDMHCELQQLHFKILPLRKLYRFYRFKSFWHVFQVPMAQSEEALVIHSIGTEGFNPTVLDSSESVLNQFRISEFLQFPRQFWDSDWSLQGAPRHRLRQSPGPYAVYACCGDSQSNRDVPHWVWAPTGWTQPPKWNTFKAVWKHVQSCSNCFCLGWRPVGFVP